MQFTQSNFLRKCELRLFSFQYTFSFSRFIQHFEADFNVVYIFVFKLQRTFVDVTFNYIWVNNAKLLITNIDGIKIHKKICQETLLFPAEEKLWAKKLWISFCSLDFWRKKSISLQRSRRQCVYRVRRTLCGTIVSECLQPQLVEF